MWESKADIIINQSFRSFVKYFQKRESVIYHEHSFVLIRKCRSDIQNKKLLM